MSELGTLQQRDMLRLNIKPEELRIERITKDDVGKFYVVGPKGPPFRIVTREEFQYIPLAEISGWWDISEFDITVFE